jgi:predicted nucleotidyltransferase
MTPSGPNLAIADFSAVAKRNFGDRCKKLILFGSRARGDSRPDSDIDILVVLAPLEDRVTDWDRCIDIAAEIAARTGELISVLICSAEEYATRDHPLLTNIRREGIPLS